MQIGDRKFSTGPGNTRQQRLDPMTLTILRPVRGMGGVDAACHTSEASVIFKVFVDRREYSTSGVMRANTPAQQVSVSVTGASELRLVVTDAGDGISADHADWAEAVLIGNPGHLSDAPGSSGTYRIRSTSLEVELTDQGEIVAGSIGNAGFRIPLRGGTALARCSTSNATSVKPLSGGGVEFARQVIHKPTGQKASLTERFLPARTAFAGKLKFTAKASLGVPVSKPGYAGPLLIRPGSGPPGKIPNRSVISGEIRSYFAHWSTNACGMVLLAGMRNSRRPATSQPAVTICHSAPDTGRA